MRSIITILLIVLFSLHSNPISAETGLGTVEDFMPMAIFDYSELGGTISGICSGESSLCVYSNSSYLIVHMDDEWDQSEKYAIDHPQIKDDAPYVRQVIFANDAYHFLVFDHAVEKSYVISQYEDDTKYGELLSKEARSITWTGDGFFLTGLDIDTQQLWYRRDHVSGDVLWEGTADTESLVPVYCVSQEDQIMVISQHTSEPCLNFSILNWEGTETVSCKVYPSDINVGTSYHVFQIDTTPNEIAMCGELISKSGSQGFFLRLNRDFTVENYHEYDQFTRIQSFAKEDSQYIMLALADIDSLLPYARYILSEAEPSMYPLEKKNDLVRTVGFVKTPDGTVCTYGLLENSVVEPDAFIAETK